jgi:hypothetical protein
MKDLISGERMISVLALTVEPNRQEWKVGDEILVHTGATSRAQNTSGPT